MKLSFVLVTFVSIFTIVNPLGAIPTFLMHADGWTPGQLKATARKSSIAMAIVLIFFAFTGTFVFQLMHITISAFQIAGGILLFSTSFQMMGGANQRRKLMDEDRLDAQHKEDISIVPLAIPLLSGPGSITTVIVLMGQHLNVVNSLVVIVGILSAALATYLIFLNARHLLNWLGASGVRIMNRVLGLFLAAISVQFMIDGVIRLIPSFTNLIEHQVSLL